MVVLAGGALIDRIGLRWGALLFSLLVTTGCVMFAISSQIASYPLAVMGRFVFGLGGESLYVCGDAILVEYFDQSQLSRVMPLAEVRPPCVVMCFAHAATNARFFSTWAISRPLVCCRRWPTCTA